MCVFGGGVKDVSVIGKKIKIKIPFQVKVTRESGHWHFVELQLSGFD